MRTMPWKSNRKPTPDLTEPPILDVTNWAESVSDAVFAETCDFIADMLKAEHFPATRNRDEYVTTSQSFLTNALDKLRIVDREEMRQTQAEQVWSYLHRDLPRLINELRTALINADNWDAEDAVITFTDSMRSIIRNIDLIPVKVTPSREQRTKDAVHNGLTVFDDSADERLQQLNQLVTDAYPNAETLEEKYRVEQIAVDYLPQSAALLNTFANAEPELREKAVSLFFQQLQLIENQLQVLVNKGANKSLSLMEEHLAFLQSQPDSQNAVTLRK